MSIFNKENIENLQKTCLKLDTVCGEHIDGSLMHSQMVFVGELIKEFLANPIVATSGLVKTPKTEE